MKSLITNADELGAALNAGLATAVGAEIIEALKYARAAAPYASEGGIGFVPDPIIRSLGVPLVTGDIPGVAVVLGKASDPADVIRIVRDYQNKGILTFLVGGVIDQIIQGGVRIGLDYRVVPLGHDVTSVTHVVTVAVRAALIFGNIQPGDLSGLLAYTKLRVPAFINTFGELDSVVVSAGAGAIALGFPVIVDVDLGENQVPGALVSVCDHAETVKTSLELRSIKIKARKVELPVSFASAFEGEIIRKADCYAEFYSNKKPTCELVSFRKSEDVTDHKIEIIGGDIPKTAAPSGIVELPLATIVDVYGVKNAYRL
jgi:CO dehydrogenase/acetyl-CoA synthase alpha subunit